MSYSILDLDSWKRKEHFLFFKEFENGWSFFLFYLHTALVSINEHEPFRYRWVDDEIRIYDIIHASSTIIREDETFGFSFIPYQKSFEDFVPGALKEIARVQAESGLNPEVSGQNVVHFSAIPWLSFTSLSHARKLSYQDSIPKISFGKLIKEKTGTIKLPVSIHVNHALMDGIHLSQFANHFQELLLVE